MQGLVYVSAWENAASAMEMAAVGARNCALLVQRHLRRVGDSLPAVDCGVNLGSNAEL